jgi:hypothetical protein
MITTPAGRIVTRKMVRLVPLKLGSRIFLAGLIAMDLRGLDVILGTRWMTQHGITLDIPSQVVEIDSPTHGTTTLYLPQQRDLNSSAFLWQRPS